MPLDPEIRERLVSSVNAGFDEQIAFTRKLINFPSTRGNEAEIQEFVAGALRDRGYQVETFEMDRAAIEAHEGGGKFSPNHSTAPNVVGTFTPETARGRSLILQAHVDVVPTGPEDMWTHPPFDARIEGDWLYGRGGADMKAGHAANIFAMDAIARAGLRPTAQIHVESVVEEESTGNGALATHLAGYRADAVLIPEPEEEMLVRANVGTIWFTVEVRGVPVHVREMGEGANAIDAAHRIVASLRELEEKWNAEKGDHPYFEDLDHPINLNIGMIEGGDWASSVPASCRIGCRIAIYPGQKAQAKADEISRWVENFASRDPFLTRNMPTITFDGFFAEGYVQEPGSEAEEILARAHKDATGETMGSFVTPGYLDCRVHKLYDKIPSLCYGPISENIHGIDERVSIESLRRITTAMTLFIAEWCGVEDRAE